MDPTPQKPDAADPEAAPSSRRSVRRALARRFPTAARAYNWTRFTIRRAVGWVWGGCVKTPKTLAWFWRSTVKVLRIRRDARVTVAIDIASFWEPLTGIGWYLYRLLESLISSAVTVALCSLWPTLINTAVGVASVDRDHLNVAKVLRLSWIKTVRKIVIPSAMPLIFTGLRLSLGVGWMVLIAAEMLAQNPGLGKFVWDMFQNGSSQTLAQIMVAVFTIGIIGFLLDRLMITFQNAVSYDGAS